VSRVLIVDDHPAFRAAARTLLRHAGYEVVGEAVDGRSAIAAVEALRPDVVLLDVQLPDMHGFTVSWHLHRSPAPPVVILTSSRDGTDYGEGVTHACAAGFIPKTELSGTAIASLIAQARA
jgi:DNA-binding NarL/FixJ family response regulator